MRKRRNGFKLSVSSVDKARALKRLADAPIATGKRVKPLLEATISAASWDDQAAISVVIAKAAEVLDAHNGSMGATKLMNAIADPLHHKLLSNALYKARQFAEFKRYWTRDTKKGYGAFGHARILYQGQQF